jgi:hypothetical protein
VGQQPGQAVLLVAVADTPDGGGVALPAGGDGLDRFAGSDGQDDPGPLDLEKGKRGLACDAL